MELNYIKNENIDKVRWDEVVASSFNGIVYAYSWYLDTVADNWDALIDEKYQYIYPIVWRKKYGIKYVYQPFFTQQLGVFSTQIITTEIVDLFLKSIPKEFKYISCQLNTYNDAKNSDFKILNRSTYELDLILPFELLKKSFSENLNRNYKKAIKNNLLSVNKLDPQQLLDLFKNDKLDKFPEIKQSDYSKLKRIMIASKGKGIGQLWAVYTFDNLLIGGAFFIESNNKIIFLFSATNKQGRELGAMPFLLIEFLKLNAGRNITIDFEGSDNENVARFYKGFGAKHTEYMQCVNNRLPFPLNLLK